MGDEEIKTACNYLKTYWNKKWTRMKKPKHSLHTHRHQLLYDMNEIRPPLNTSLKHLETFCLQQNWTRDKKNRKAKEKNSTENEKVRVRMKQQNRHMENGIEREYKL